ncbi:SURF1 family protein [Nevskia ramosa]|uniref:SURF1 family protein n=1 Tax=Nevskia ramosa TaxID=64002 RepID=UPI003D098D0A
MDTARRWPRFALLVGLALAFIGFVVLGSWQLERRTWKLALIERVETQLQAASLAAPGPATWDRIGRDDEYRRVSISGRYRHDLETCTQAVTVRGPGCWVLTPLETVDGWLLLINRGFVDPAQRDRATRAEGQPDGIVAIDGLLRLSEPRGGFLRCNDPGQGRWYSRDVAAIAAARGLPAERVAPYFVDASGSVPGGPIGGLTVVRFRNSHLVYALTWYGLAALSLAGAWLAIRPDQRRRSKAEAP